MPAILDEDCARRLLDMPSTIEAMRAAFAREAQGRAAIAERCRRRLFGKSLNVMAAADAATGRYAVKIYGGGAFHILLYEGEGSLLAVMEADWLGRLRTGAATGLATDLMARQDAALAGLIGAGRQARAQLSALAAVRNLKSVRVYARRQEALEAFCREMQEALLLEVVAASSPQEAVAGADVVVTATTSAEPVLRAEWLAPGAHVNAVGANSAQRMELDPEILRRAAVLVVDHVGQARREAAGFIRLAEAGELDWSSVRTLSQIVAAGGVDGARKGLSVFKSLGVGLEDLAVASLLYDRVLRESDGRS